MQNTKQILTNAKTIAIIGLSPKPHRQSYKVAKYLQENGYKIIPIHKSRGTILDSKIYQDINDVPYGVDILNIFVNASMINEIAQKVNLRDDIAIIWSQLGIYNDEAFNKIQNKTLVLDMCIKQEHEKIFFGKTYANACEIND